MHSVQNSKFVQQFQNKLRYFGDLRNQLVHGFSLDKKHYVVASDYAVQQIKRVYEELTKPKPVAEVFDHEVFSCTTADSLKDIIQVLHSDEVKVGDIPLENSNDTFLFVDGETSIYEIQELFLTSHEQKKRLGAVFVTSSWDETTPITGIITAMDLPKLASMRIL